MFGSLPSSAEHGSSHVAWRSFRNHTKTTRKLISFIFAGIKCENCVVVVQKKKLCLTGASLPIVVTSRTRRGIFQCIGFRFTAIQGQKHRNGVKHGSTGLSWNGQSGNHQYIPVYARSILNQKSLCSSSAINEADLSNNWLQRDELGVCVFPSIHSGAKEKPLSERDKRMVR